MIALTNKIILENSAEIIKHLREIGGMFGDTNITSEANIFKSISYAVPDIAQYCKDYKIEITELDTIKLLVFAMPYIKKHDPAINIERYITSIFRMLEKSYKISVLNQQQIKNSIRVCNNLFEGNKILVVYGYIKGFQEALKYTYDKTRTH